MCIRDSNNVQSEVSSITEDTIDKNLDDKTTVNKKEDKDEQKSS